MLDQDMRLAEKLVRITFYLNLLLQHTWIFYDTIILIIVILNNNVIFTKFWNPKNDNIEIWETFCFQSIINEQ